MKKSEPEQFGGSEIPITDDCDCDANSTISGPESDNGSHGETEPPLRFGFYFYSFRYFITNSIIKFSSIYYLSTSETEKGLDSGEEPLDFMR